MDKLTTTPIPYKPTHILYKGSQLEEEVMLIKYCHDPTWVIIVHKNSTDIVKMMYSNLTPIEVDVPKHNFWIKAGNYLLNTVVPVLLGVVGGKVLKTKK